jgi:hypothetical protein
LLLCLPSSVLAKRRRQGAMDQTSPRCSSLGAHQCASFSPRELHSYIHVPRRRSGEARRVEEHAAKALERLDAVRRFDGPIKILRDVT